MPDTRPRHCLPASRPVVEVNHPGRSESYPLRGIQDQSRISAGDRDNSAFEVSGQAVGRDTHFGIDDKPVIPREPSLC